MGLRIAGLLLLLSVIAASCSSPVTQSEAESIAMEFVKDRVKFFARSENATVDIPSYTFESVTTSLDSGNYVVELNVTSRLGNETKSADLQVVVDSKGKVISLQKVSSK